MTTIKSRWVQCRAWDNGANEFFGGQFPELWGRIMCILAGPAIIGTWVLGTWMNFKRYWV
jgi:hypothetical protein